MAFTIANWTCISSSLNQGQETITPYRGSPTVENAPNIFMYGSPNDNIATIGSSNYFLSQYKSLAIGDWIMGFGTDSPFIYQVTASSSSSVTVEAISIGGGGSNTVTFSGVNTIPGDIPSWNNNTGQLTGSGILLGDAATKPVTNDSLNSVVSYNNTGSAVVNNLVVFADVVGSITDSGTPLNALQLRTDIIANVSGNIFNSGNPISLPVMVTGLTSSSIVIAQVKSSDTAAALGYIIDTTVTIDSFTVTLAAAPMSSLIIYYTAFIAPQ